MKQGGQVSPVHWIYRAVHANSPKRAPYLCQDGPEVFMAIPAVRLHPIEDTFQITSGYRAGRIITVREEVLAEKALPVVVYHALAVDDVG